VNGGFDALVTLSDGSTMLLKYVSHLDGSFLCPRKARRGYPPARSKQKRRR
jgi:hypothetical protein